MATNPGQQKAELMVEHNLSQADLNRKVTEDHMWELEGIIIAWDDIASKLLEEVDVAAVEQDGRNAAQKKQKMLQTWKERNGNGATYDKMIMAMLKARKKDQATKVFELLQPGGAQPNLPVTPQPQSHSHLDDEPTLIALGNLTKKDGTTFSVIAEIGADYHKVGIQLLKDEKGATMNAIKHEHKGCAEDITTEMFRKWLNGRGMTPRTWRTLVEVLELKPISLGALASNIRDALQ